MRQRVLLLALVVSLATCISACDATGETSAEDPPVNPSSGSTWTRPLDGMVMLYVPSGTFLMGSTEGDPDTAADEFPQHLVTVDGFWIDQTEVTNAQYALCIPDGECGEPVFAGNQHYNQQDQPVVGITWYDAVAYCELVGARLPTEAEWEYAARGEQRFIFPWGNEFECTRGNFDDELEFDRYTVPGGAGCDGYVRPAPVGSFPTGASWCGALDMAGNAWEWTADWHGDYPAEPQTNPAGPAEGENKVIRGGGWDSNHTQIRTSFRHDLFTRPGIGYDFIGFRCVMSAPGE